jgi:peptidoglycan L-alanyl-D-glutamate endopeptidase CwlK
MTVKTADKSLLHLYPPFRAKLAQVLKETEAALGEPWVATETYRSPERQLYLFAQGRTRPGPVITWLKSPQWHGAGLAADCMSKSRVGVPSGYQAPRLWWETYRRIYMAHGLENPAWSKGDLGHVQLSDPAVRARALVWVRAGFKEPAVSREPSAVDPATGLPLPAISVMVDGQPVPDADAYLDSGKAWVKLRPVTDSLDLVIAEVTGKGATRLAVLVDDSDEWRVPVALKEGRAYVKATDLPAGVYWVGGEKLLSITPRRRNGP